jgi:seryl-tRNA synthetase
MLDIQLIRKEPDAVISGLKRRGMEADISDIVDLDRQWRETLAKTDELRHLRNKTSQEISQLAKKGKDFRAIRERMRTIAEDIRDLEDTLRELEEAIQQKMLWVPNIPHATTPDGISSEYNVEVRQWGLDLREFDFALRDHIDLGKSLDILDFPRGSKITGSGFPLYKGLGASLERALLNFMLDVQVKEKGYQEVLPPFMVNRESMLGTGQLPKLESDMYHCEVDDLFLVPTAEVPMTNMHRDEILDEDRLPLCYAGYTACFRREAGSYGKETRGFLRVHQFNKIELVKFVHPERSYSELESLLDDAEEILRRLEIPYRVVELCAGDLSFAATKCYDIEVWAPAEQAWLEASSCSSFEDFQARRMNIRFRSKDSKRTQFVHTLNGSGLATSRLMVALLENCQTDEGTIAVPDVLRPYMGVSMIGLPHSR